MSRAGLIALCLFVLLAPAASAAAPGWAPAAPLGNARQWHSAVLLDDGRVLVAGGIGESELGASAELFDPATNRWTPTGSLHQGRYGAAMVKLADGRVLIAGGTSSDYGPLYVGEVYDPRTGRWTPTKAVVSPRYSAASVLLPNGKVLLAGGWKVPCCGSLNTAEVYDPTSNEWFPAGEFDESVGNPVAALLPDGRAIVTGGIAEDGPSLTARRYNGGISWTTVAPMRVRRSLHALTALPDGRLLAAGGTGFMNGSEFYDTRTNTWTPGAPIRGTFISDATVSLGRGLVLTTGSHQVDENDPEMFRSAQVYVPATDTWSPTGAPTPRGEGSTMTALADGRVLLAGGTDGPDAMALTEIWTPTTTLATESAVAFGDAAVSTGVGGVVQVTNTGQFPLFLGDLAIRGAHPGDYTANGDRCRGAIAPGTTCAIDVRFTPTEAGVRGATLTIEANTAGAHVVPLGGRGMAAPPLPLGAGPDGDGDGVPDAQDRCPATRGGAARSGCPAGLLADPSIRYQRLKRGIKVIAYYVKATTGARITVTCTKKSCKRAIAKGTGSKPVRIKALNGKRLRNGTSITVSVSMPGRLTTRVTDRIAKSRRTEGRPRCAPVGC